MKKFKDLYPNFSTFKTELNAITANTVLDTDQPFFTYLSLLFGEKVVKYSDNEAKAKSFSSWQQFRNIWIKVLNEQKKDISDLIKQQSFNAVATGDQGQIDLDKVLDSYYEQGGSSVLKPQIINFLQRIVNISNIYTQLANSFTPIFSLVGQDGYDTALIKGLESEYEVLASQLGILITDKILKHPDFYSKTEVNTELAKKADKSQVITSQQKSDITSNKSALQLLAPKVQANETQINTNKGALNNLLTNTLPTNYYTKTATNTLLNDKADKTTLNAKADKTRLNALAIVVNQNQSNFANFYNKTQSDARFLSQSSARGEYLRQATYQEDFASLSSAIEAKKKLSVRPTSQGTYPQPTRAGDVILKEYFDKNKGSGGALDNNFIELDKTNDLIKLKKQVNLEYDNILNVKGANSTADIKIDNTSGNLTIRDTSTLKGIVIGPTDSSIAGFDQRTPTLPSEFIQKWWYEDQRNKAIAGVQKTVREATGLQHLAFLYWTSARKSNDIPWRENGDSNGQLGIEKNNNTYFLDSSNTNIFKQGKNYDIQINIFKNGGSNNQGTQLNLFGTALNSPGSSQVQQDTAAVVQTFDTYQFSVNNNFGPSQTNRSHIIREPGLTFDEFNELNIYLRLRKLSNNQLVISTLEPIRKFSKRNDGNYLLTRSDFVAKIANTGNGKFWKFGLKTGNWDNITRVEFFVRGESQ